MKIVFVEQESHLGGVEYTTLRVAQTLNKENFDVVILCPCDGDLPQLARQSGVTVDIVPRPTFHSVSFFLNQRYFANPFGFVVTALNVFRAMLALRKYFQINAPAMVVTKGLLAHFYGGWAAHMLNIPCIWYIQEEVDEKRAAGLYRFILNWGAQKFPARIVVDASALLGQFTPNLRHRIKVIYNGVDTNQFLSASRLEKQKAKEKFGIPSDAIVIGQASRIIPLKGQNVLLESFVSLAQKFPNAHLLFVGAPLFGSQDYEQKLRLQAMQSGFSERIHFTGFVPEVRQGLAAMDIFVHASIETDSPVSVLEAMSCGLPLVVSAVDGTREMVENEINALVFEPGNSDHLALLLGRLLQSDTLRIQLAQRAREKAIKDFSLQATVNQLEHLLIEARDD